MSAPRPPWVGTVTVARKRDGKDIGYCLLNHLPALLWAANLASIELHTSLARASSVNRPRAVVFDLDPGAPADVVDCGEIALELRSLLEDLDLACFPKTSGSKGLQLFVPLNSSVTYDGTAAFALAAARATEERLPDRVVTKMAKELRPGKVFIDWSQNGTHKTTVSVYSLRARARPTVSTPVTWDEIEGAVTARDPELLVFDARTVLERLERHGDLFEPVLKLRQRLPRL